MLQANFYQREIARRLNLPIRAIQRELSNLCAVGLLTARASGNRSYYSLDSANPIKNELKNIILKSSGIAEALSIRLKEHKDIEFAFIYGSYALDKESLSSDIDLLIIGDISSRKLSSILSKEKLALGREINFSVYSKPEFLMRIRGGQPLYKFSP